MSENNVQQKKKRPLKGVARAVIIGLIAGGIFWLGVNIGQGNITLTSTSANKNLPADLNYQEVEQLYDILRAQYDGKLDQQKLIEGLKSGLVDATGDPYTEFLNVKEAKELNDQLGGTFSGIGAELGKNSDDDIIIVSPISGFPAEKAGLRPQDVVIAVNGESTTDMSIDEAVSKIRGEKGTEVKLDVIRNKEERKNFTITRDTITIPSVEYEILPNNIGYIQISQFWNDTARLTREAAQEFRQANVKGVILDMRGNPGGSLDAAVNVAGVWLSNGKTVLQEKRDGKVEQTYSATGTPILENVPTVVLINEGSASASEIVAGALKDNKAATLLGAKTYGKGSVQQIVNLGDGSELKVTIARWHRPNGQNIDKKGITPDVKIEMSEEDYASGRDPQKDKAIERLTAQ